MYSPGDIVVGYPDYAEDTEGRRFLHREFFGTGHGREGRGMVRCSKNKFALMAGAYPAIRKSVPEEFSTELISYKEIKGMVIESDGLGTERPHWDGVVSVLIGERILWFWARNIRIGKFGKGFVTK